jgi:hypothetical protein
MAILVRLTSSRCDQFEWNHLNPFPIAAGNQNEWEIKTTNRAMGDEGIVSTLLAPLVS